MSADRPWRSTLPVGTSGASGPQGAQGAQGAPGAQGSQGAQGSTGAAGAQGPQGNQGAAGAQGAQGSQGPQGGSGAQGTQGTQGPRGVTVGIPWTYDTNTTIADPGNGKLRTNAGFTQMAIDILDANGVDQSAWLATLSGAVLNFQKDDGSSIQYPVTSVTNSTGYFTLGLGSPIPFTGSFSNGDTLRLTVSPRGLTGAQGVQGSTGAQGSQGSQGSQGAVGATSPPHGIKFNYIGVFGSTFDPGAGNLGLYTGGTYFFLSYTDVFGDNLAAYLQSLTDASGVYTTGFVTLTAANSNYSVAVTYGGVDNGSWAEVGTLSNSINTSKFTSGQPIYLSWTGAP